MKKDEYICEGVSRIKNKKARQDVARELYAHIDDRISYYTDAGWDEDAANEKAMSDMGKAEDISEKLGFIHNFWKGYLIILVAAVTLVMVIICCAPTVGKEFVVKTFSDHFEYSVTDRKASKALTDLQINYIPEGFIMDNNVDDMKTVKNKMFLHGDEYFNVEKKSINDTIGFDTDTSEDYVIINNITYLYYGDAAYNLNGYIWNNGDYIYYIEGNISKDELLKIAQSVE